MSRRPGYCFRFLAASRTALFDAENCQKIRPRLKRVPDIRPTVVAVFLDLCVIDFRAKEDGGYGALRTRDVHGYAGIRYTITNDYHDIMFKNFQVYKTM